MMSGDKDLDGKDLLTSGTGGRSSSSGSSSGSRGGKRTQVTVKLGFGTRIFAADTQCGKCGKKAEGVMVYEEVQDGSDDPIEVAKPVCKTHRKEVQNTNRINWDYIDYHRFK
jgi:hypothetical protein